MSDRRIISLLNGILGRIIARVIGPFYLTLNGTLTADRTQTARDASGNLCLDTVNNAFTATQTITAGTVAQQRSLKLVGGDGGGSPGGLYLVSATNSGGDGATVEAVGQRNDGNGSSGFCGQFALAHLRTDAAMTASGVSLGRLKFGGNPTDTSLANVVYSAQMRGYAAGAWSSSAAMPTGIVFSTGSAGIVSGSGSEAGTDAVWIDHLGNLGIGVTPTAGNGLVQLASGTTAASGYACGTDTHWFRDSAGSWSADSNIKVATVGKGLYVKEGTNATMGAGTLVTGAVVISTTKVTANSRIFLTSQVDGGTVGFLRVSTRTAATSFTINSSNVLDTSTVAWIIMEPA